MSNLTPETQTGKGLWTYSDYLKLPDDGKRYEILEGELFVSPAPLTQHQRVSKRLLLVLNRALEETGRGEVLYSPLDVMLDDLNVVQPDLIFVRSKNSGIVLEKCVKGSPDLLVEILSPSTHALDRGLKKSLYARFGVPHYWILDLESKCLESFRSKRREYRLTLSAKSPERVKIPGFPGLNLDLKDLFAS